MADKVSLSDIFDYKKICLTISILVSAIIHSNAQKTNQTRGFITNDGVKTIEIVNNGSTTANFKFRLNGKSLFPTTTNIIQYISEMPDEFAGEDVTRKVWRFTRDFRYHNVPLNWNCWYSSNPAIGFNSVGFGFCGNVSAWNYVLWSKLGYTARYWELGGVHVVSEVFNNGRWNMYDSDNEVYYLNHKGDIANVEDIKADTSLITHPVLRFKHDSLNSLRLDPSNPNTTIDYAYTYAYSDYIASAYTLPSVPSDSSAYTSNSCIFTDYTEPVDGYETNLILPPSAKIKMFGEHIPLVVSGEVSFYPDAIIDMYQNISIEIPGPGEWTGKLPFLPLLVQSITGSGKVKILGNNGEIFINDTYDIGSTKLNKLLSKFWMPYRGIEIINGRNLQITYLLNPRLFAWKDQNYFELSGDNIDDLDFSGMQKIPQPSIESDIHVACVGDTVTLRTQTYPYPLSYQWYKNDTLLVNDSAYKLQITKRGEYKVMLKYSNVTSISSETYTPTLYDVPNIKFPEEIKLSNDSLIKIPSSIKRYLHTQAADFQAVWYLDDEPLDAPQDIFKANLHPLKDGTYQVVVYDSGCSRSSNEFNVEFVNKFVSIDQFNPVVYPNPTTNDFNLAINGVIDEPLTVRLSDLNGKEIFQKHIFDSPYINPTFTFNTEEITSGYYIVSVENRFGKKYFKLIKQ